MISCNSSLEINPLIIEFPIIKVGVPLIESFSANNRFAAITELTF